MGDPRARPTSEHYVARSVAELESVGERRAVDLARPPPVALGASGVVVLGIPAGMDACPV
jgi:hypothetical protein